MMSSSDSENGNIIPKMQTTSKRIVGKTKSKETVKDEQPMTSRKLQQDNLKKNVTTPRKYLQTTTPVDIYGKKKPNVLHAPKKVASSLSSNTAKNESPMKNLLKSTPSSVSQVSSIRSLTKMAPERKLEAKANQKSARNSTTRTVKGLSPSNIVVNSPISKRKSSLDVKKERSNLNNDSKISNITSASVNEDKGKPNMADMFLRQRSKTRTLDENEVKVLKSDVVDNNAQMKNLSQRLSAKPKSFYVDLNGVQMKPEKEKSSEEEVSYEDDFESYESDFDSYHSETQSEKNSSTTDEEGKSEENQEELESNIDLERVEEISAKDTKDEERMLDSGSYDLRDPQRSAQKLKPVRLDFILEGTENADKKSLTDEGFQELSSSSTVSSMKAVHTDVLDRPLFIDFTISKVNRRKRRIFQQLQQRAKDILNMITLHEMTYMLFEMKPIPYDLYMATFGRSNCAQIAVQTFDDGVTEEVQTDEISNGNKWTQFPVEFSKQEVCLNTRTENRKKGDEFLTKFSVLVSQKVEVNHIDNCEDKDYKDNPLRIFLEQRDGVGSDEILQKDVYTNKLKQTVFNVNRLKKFLKKVESRISSILSINAGSPDTCNLIKSSKFPFSKGYVNIPIKNVSNKLSFLKELKITNVILSKTSSNIIISVHERSPSNVFIQKCILCIWDISIAMQEPLKILIATDNVTIGRLRGRTDGIVIAALRDGTIHLWDLSEQATWTQKDISNEKPTNLVDLESVRLTQTELDREWNLKNRHISYEKENLYPMQSCAYTSSGMNILNSNALDGIVGLEFMGDSNMSTGHEGGSKIIAQVCSLQLTGILILWSVVQEKVKSNVKDIGKAFWSKLSLEKVQTIDLTVHLDVNVKDTLENNFTKTFNLNAAKRRISIKRQEKSLLRQDSCSPKSASRLYSDNSRPRSAASANNRGTFETPTNKDIWETGIVCNDLKVMRINNTDNFLIAKNCGEVLCCTRYAGTFKVNRFCVANDTCAITCLETSQNGLPYILAATESGTVNLCSVKDFRVLLTLDCRNGSSTVLEKCKADQKGRFISSIKTESFSANPIDIGKEQKVPIQSLVWSRSNPFDMFAFLHNGTLCAWRLTSSDINARRVEDAAAVCAASGDSMALVTTQNEVQVHRLSNEEQDKDNLDLFQKYLALL